MKFFRRLTYPLVAAIAILIVLTTISQVARAANVEDAFLQGGPFEKIEVNAESPTPYMTAYQPKSRLCTLLVNLRVKPPEGLMDTVAKAHEAGHCLALRLGRQNIDAGTTLQGEVFADVYAITWVQVNMPDRLDEAVNLLLAERSMNRQVDRAYNTMFMVRQAVLALSRKPSTQSVEDFVVGFLFPKD